MPRADRVPFVPGRSLVAVRATLNHLADVVLVVDTGAQRTVLSRQAAVRLGLDLDRPTRLQALVGIGQSVPVPVVRLDSLQVGSSAIEGLEVSVYELPAAIRADGLLGLSFLRHFRVTCAFDSGELVLREPSRR